MKRALATALTAGIGLAGMAGCGGGGDTTVVQAAPTSTASTTTVTEKAPKPTAAPKPKPQPAPAPEPTPSEPPDVVGLTLPTAKKQLSKAGFRADVSNTDTTFGIIVEKNYTVCKQSDPRGKIVPILAQKYGC